MAAKFPGFPAEALTFFKQLRRNNTREWFQPRKTIYEENVKAPMLELVAAVNAEMMRFAPNYTNDPEKAIYRIYRDTRFSKDKTPYKTHIAAIFPRRGTEKHAGAGLYFSVSPEEIEVAGGVYMPGPSQLLLVRTYLADHHEEFLEIVTNRTLIKVMGELKGETLSRVPKGFLADHPAANLLRHKQWLFYVGLDPNLATTPKLLSEIVQRFRAMTPFADFLNTPLTARRRLSAKELLL